MIRTIRYRGLRSDTRKWVYGGISVFENEATIFDESDMTNSAYEVDIISVGEFTGITDKNGNELFEGDIIKTSRGDWGIIVFKAPFFEVTVSESQSSMYSREWFATVEKIGNIHENPELLIDVK